MNIEEASKLKPGDIICWKANDNYLPCNKELPEMFLVTSIEYVGAQKYAFILAYFSAWSFETNQIDFTYELNASNLEFWKMIIVC